jgi:hypothetical protein
VQEVAHRTAERVEKLLQRAGRSLDPELQSDPPPPALLFDEPGLASCYAAAAQGISVSGERAGMPTLRLVSSTTPPGPMRWVEAAASKELLAARSPGARSPSAANCTSASARANS